MEKMITNASAAEPAQAPVPAIEKSRSLDPLFRPGSIAVVGASRRRGSIGSEVFYNLLRCGFEGPVYPVNPTTEFVHSVRAYGTVPEIPGPVELAVIVVPARAVSKIVDDCIAKGVRAVVILSAGFAETGEAGRSLQKEIVEKCRREGIRLVGPNCLGLLNTDPAVRMDATFAPTWPPAGSVAFSSQSGALGLAILDYAKDLGIGISQFVSVGNKADVSGNDLIEYWEADPVTRVILLYLESFGNPRRFMRIARRVSRTKPIVVVKSGRTSTGARAATSHTGAMASKEIAVDALLTQTGVIRTDTIEELFDMAMLLANQPIPRGNRVAILTNAGGPGIMASDACESRGLIMPELSPITIAGLRGFLPKEASVRNPVDMIASATPASFERALPLLLQDPVIDSVVVLFVPPVVTEASDVADAIRRGAAGSDKPVLTCFMGTHGVPPALSSLHEGKIPSYAFPEAAALALSRAVRYGRWLSRPVEEPPFIEGTALDRARRIIEHSIATTPSGDGTHWMDSEDVARLLESFGLRTVQTRFAGDVEDAVRGAAEIGFPVALKVDAESVTHKTDIGGVILDIEDEEGVRRAFCAVRERLVAHGHPQEAFRGVTLQGMAPSGVETFIGISRDPAFGPLIGFGIGGVNIEIWQDVVFRICPVTREDVHEMMEQIRGARLLDGFRGAPASDRVAIAEALLRVSQMALELPEIEELDINPLVALEQGHGVIAVDARVRLRRVS